MHDLKFAIRQLTKSPGFTMAVVAITAIGIGAVTLMYSVLWGVLLRPLPFPEPQRLVFVQAKTDQGNANSLSALDYFDYREQCDAFESLAARSIWQPGRVVLGSGEPERVPSNKVSDNFFQTFGMPMTLGRSFLPDEAVAGGRDVVVVSHEFWQRKLAGNPDVIGHPLTIDGRVCEIVGVAPADFDYPAGVQLWFPMQRGGPEESGRGNNNFVSIGRLATGVDLAQARSRMEVAAARISKANPMQKGGWSVQLTPLHEQFFGNLRPTLTTLMSATALVLLIACANLSSLLMARILSRRGEIAIRLSLGAPASVLARQLLIETFVVTLLGATAGVFLAVLGIDAIKAVAPPGIPRLAEVHLDAHVLAIALAATAITTALSGLLPAVRGARVDLLSNLRESGRTTEGRGHLTIRRMLVGVQVALSLVLLVTTGLLLQSAVRLQRVDPGFDAHRLLMVNVQFPLAGHNGKRVLQRFEALLERLRALPGVVNVAGADELPLFGGPWNGLYRSDQPPQSSSDLLPATRRFVTPGFFQTMRIPLLAGRYFDPASPPGPPYKVIVSQALVRRLYPNEDPVGQILMLPGNKPVPLEIIGVVGDVRDFGLAAELRPAFYGSLSQLEGVFDSSTLRLIIRCDGEPAALMPSVRAAIRELEKDAPLFGVGTMGERLVQSTAQNRFSATLLGVFAVIAVILAATGLYGLMSFLVARRTRELGIRIALGAQMHSVVNLVIRQGMLLTAGGVALGVVGALVAARFIASQLYNVSSTDIPTLVLACLALVAAALFACWLPARRAAKVDPMAALRAE